VKISEVRALVLQVPLAAMSPPSSWAAGMAKQVLVRVASDTGLVGWGECFAYGAPLAVANVVDDALGPLLVGEDPTAIEPLTRRMHQAR
jgi:L-alanine-DL-glutamate epimerase-like enolase superfamily enzyme